MTTSAALLLHRDVEGVREVLIGHMGGPFWARKDAGGWSIPKGEYVAPEPPLAAARREFTEETGLPAPEGDVVELGEFRQGSGKRVTVFALESDLDLTGFAPGTFTMPWPPRSGREQEFPELDRIAWLPLAEAADLVVKGQRPALEALAAHLA
ncbi:NUDIX domain-containing protein [Spongisporangium articulatum]|uniref:NUDIX domain-containing protein n=1 Tax=Spongisporangium articulatum TaxID=3362603 RepID=A0ABW8ALL1_9ACTN